MPQQSETPNQEEQDMSKLFRRLKSSPSYDKFVYCLDRSITNKREKQSTEAPILKPIIFSWVILNNTESC